MISKILIVLIGLVSILNAQNSKMQNKTLENLISEAIKVSPKIKMLQSKLNAAGSKIEIGTNLPDPTLTLGLANLPTNSFSFTQEPMTGKIIGLSQAIPFPGKLGAAAEVKAIDTLIIKEEINDLKNEIKKNVSTLYFDLGLFRKEIKLAKESEALLKQISEVVKSKYQVSKANLQNVIQVAVQITRVQDKIESLKGKENAALAELNAILLRDANSEIESDEVFSLDLNIYKTPTLLKIADNNRPFLKGIKYTEEKFKLKEELAGYSYYPNFKLGLQYSQRDYNGLTGADFNDFFSVVVGITLPLNYGGKNTAEVNEAKYLQAFSRDRYNSSMQILNQSLSKITAKLDEIKSRDRLVSKTLLPQAEKLLQAALADYQVGKIDFVNVINAENDILKIKTELIKIRTDYVKNIAKLEFLIGTQIENSNIDKVNGEQR